MDENNINQPSVNSETPKVNQGKKFFYFAIGVIIVGFAIVVGVFLLAFPKNNETPTNIKTTDAQINSVSGLDQASQQLDQADFSSFDKSLQANDLDSSKF